LTCHWLLRFSFFSPSLSVPTQIVFTVLLKNFTFLPWQRVHILQPFFFFAIPFLIFFPFFRSFAHFTHCFVWSPSNLTLVLFTFYAILFFSTLFSRPFGRPLIPFSSLLTVQFLAFCPKLFTKSGSIAVFLFSSLFSLWWFQKQEGKFEWNEKRIPAQAPEKKENSRSWLVLFLWTVLTSATIFSWVYFGNRLQ